MRYLLILILLIQAGFARGQSPVDDYVRLGLENNLALKQKEAEYKASLEVLKQAKSLFYPNISLNARYSLAMGGRTIDLPIGDLLNPVYATLNQILRENRFPLVDNQSFMFLRPHEQETKVRVVQPLFNTDIYYNSRIRQELAETDRITVEQYRQELVAEIRKAYYQAAMAEGIRKMLSDSRILLEENVRVNRTLCDNGKLTVDHVYRAESELSKFDRQLLEAGKNSRIAAAYLNFLVNKRLTDPVPFSEPEILPAEPASDEQEVQSALSKREEMKKLAVFSRISDLQVNMNRASSLPNLMVVADYGIQGEQYTINKDADFAQASAVLTWDLFTGFQNRAKVGEARMRQEVFRRKTEETRQQIALQVMNALDGLRTSAAGIEAAERQVTGAREGFRLVKRRYEEGQASLVEFIDARTNLTQAEENLIISKFTWLTDYAEYQKVCALTETR